MLTAAKPVLTAAKPVLTAAKPVLTAAKFMYGGAAVTAAYLPGALPFIGDIHGKAPGQRLV